MPSVVPVRSFTTSMRHRPWEWSAAQRWPACEPSGFVFAAGVDAAPPMGAVRPYAESAGDAALGAGGWTHGTAAVPAHSTGMLPAASALIVNTWAFARRGWTGAGVDGECQ